MLTQTSRYTLDEIDVIAEHILEELRDNGWPGPSESESNRQIMCIAEEAGEVLGAYRRWAGLARRTGTKNEMEAELADLLITVLIACHMFNIDIREVTSAKIAIILNRGWKDPR